MVYLGNMGVQTYLGRDGNTYYSRAAWEAANREWERTHSSSGGYDQGQGQGYVPSEEDQANFQSLYDQAREDNQRQYQEMLNAVNSMTGQSEADVNADYKQAESRGIQRLYDRGFGGSSIVPVMRMGYQRERQNALNRLADRQLQQRLGVIGSMNYEYPDPSNPYSGLYKASGSTTSTTDSTPKPVSIASGAGLGSLSKSKKRRKPKSRYSYNYYMDNKGVI